jgi:D-alanyl-D-alanine carboxypeptidase
VTVTAGACLASYLAIAERRFVIVVFNCKKMSMRFSDT